MQIVKKCETNDLIVEISLHPCLGMLQNEVFHFV